MLRQILIFSVLVTCLTIQLSNDNLRQYPINIQKSFSNTSDITVVITSCNRTNQLAITVNTFFHYNTYPIRKMIIIEDCQPSNILQIGALLPQNFKKYPQFFYIKINNKKKGQIASIDQAYSHVETKYVYHLEDDWAQLRGYGMLERLKSVAIDCEKKQKMVSQIVQTFTLWDWSHQLGKAQWTQNKIRYHKITSYGKDWLYRWSFNPHLLNMQVYKKQLKSSLMKTIAKNYHCIKDGNQVMQDGGCVEKYLGQHLSQLGYRQYYMNIGDQPFYLHTGEDNFNQKPIKLEHQGQPIDYSSNPIPVVDPLPQNPSSENSEDKTQTKSGMSSYSKVFILLLSLLMVFSFFKGCQSVFGKNKSKFSEISQDQLPESQSVMRNIQNE